MTYTDAQTISVPGAAAEFRPRARAFRAFGILLLIAGVSLLFQLASLSRHLDNIYDEGLILVGAQRILQGDIPYRDFWGMYAPGQFYAVAALFKLAAPSVLIEQLWDVAIRSGIVVMTYLWARRLGAGAYTHAAWLVALMVVAGTDSRGFPVFPALLLGLVSGYLALGAMASARPAWRLCAAGACAGIAALFRHDMGLYVVVAETLVLAWTVWGTDAWAARLARMLLSLGLGALLAIAPMAIYLLVNAPLADLWFNLFHVPASIYPKVRGLPFPPLPDPYALLTGAAPLPKFSESVWVYFPLVVGAAALAYLAVLTRRRDAASPEETLRRLGILLLALITLLLYLKGSVRISALHVVQSVVPAAVLCFVLLARIGRVAPTRRAIVGVLAAIVAVALAAQPGRTAFATAAENVSMLPALRNETGLRLGLARLCAPPGGLERARCLAPREADIAVAKFIRSRTQPGEPIYSGVATHDRVFINNIQLYFLAERPPATKWHEVHPGIQTSASVQAQMIEEFKASGVRYLVLSTEWDHVREPNASSVSSGVTLLDDYIRANFDVIEKFGPASIWQRR